MQTNSSVTRDFTVAVYLVYNKKVLLVFHKKLKMWLPPSGHLEPNELPHIGAIREVAEETGLEIELYPRLIEKKLGSSELLPMPVHMEVHPIEQGPEHVCFDFFGKALTTKERLNETESDEIRWFSQTELDQANLDEKVRSFAKEAIATVR